MWKDTEKWVSAQNWETGLELNISLAEFILPIIES